MKKPPMKTKLVGIREFRQNMASYSQKIKKNNWSYVVLSHNEPLFKVEPFDEDEYILKKFAKEIEVGLEDVRQGRVYTPEEVRRHLGI